MFEREQVWNGTTSGGRGAERAFSWGQKYQEKVLVAFVASQKRLFSTAIPTVKFYWTHTHSDTGNTEVISGEFSDEQETHILMLKDSMNKIF